MYHLYAEKTQDRVEYRSSDTRAPVKPLGTLQYL